MDSILLLHDHTLDISYTQLQGFFLSLPFLARVILWSLKLRMELFWITIINSMAFFSFDILPCTFSITVSHSCVKKLWQLEPHLSVTFRLIYMSSLFGVNLSFAVHLPREKKYMKFNLDITKICLPQTDIHNNYSKARTVRTALFIYFSHSSSS